MNRRSFLGVAAAALAPLTRLFRSHDDHEPQRDEITYADLQKQWQACTHEHAWQFPQVGDGIDYRCRGCGADWSVTRCMRVVDFNSKSGEQALVRRKARPRPFRAEYWAAEDRVRIFPRCESAEQHRAVIEKHMLAKVHALRGDMEEQIKARSPKPPLRKFRLPR